MCKVNKKMQRKLKHENAFIEALFPKPVTVKYEIICKDSTVELVEEINKRLNEGWRCQGGVCVIYYEVKKYRYTELGKRGTTVNEISYYQAMILEEKQ